MTSLSTSIVGSGVPVAFLHGFTQTKESWFSLLEEMRTDIQATLVDAPNHGQSRESLNLVETGDAVVALCRNNTLVGYSMGARMALMAALKSPESFPRLILISGTAGLETEVERQQRIQSDETLARHIEEIGVESFIPEWLSNPLFTGLSQDKARISERLTNTATGLATSLRLCGTGQQPSLWDQLHRLTMPVLVIAGEKDQKFCDLAVRLHDLIPHSDLHIHPGVGHTVHLEDSKGCASVIDEWLERTNR